MKYTVYYTETAERDVEDTARYIMLSLKNPVAADQLLIEVDKAVNSLAHMPERYRLVDDLVLASWGIRFVQVKNYLAFYTISPQTATVHIIRFLYRRSDWAFILRSSYIPEA